MSAYITIAELESLGVNSAALAGLTTDQKNAAIVASSGEADNHMRNRYPVPLEAPIDDALKLHIAAHAGYTALRMRGFNPQNIDEAIREGHQDAVRYFEKLASGKVSLNISVDPPAPEVDGAPIIESWETRGFESDFV